MKDAQAILASFATNLAHRQPDVVAVCPLSISPESAPTLRLGTLRKRHLASGINPTSDVIRLDGLPLDPGGVHSIHLDASRYDDTSHEYSALQALPRS